MISTPPTNEEEFAALMTGMMPFHMHDQAVLETVSLDGTIFSFAAGNRGFDVLGEWSSVDRLSTITAPTLLPFGKHDVFTAPPQSHRIARRIPGAETVEFTNSGHMPWLEEPDRFFEVITDWLGRIGVWGDGLAVS